MSATIRTAPNTPEDEIATILRAHGIRIEQERIYDHPEDRTFELKLSGPARQFEVATAALHARSSIHEVHID